MMKRLLPYALFLVLIGAGLLLSHFLKQNRPFEYQAPVVDETVTFIEGL